MKYVLLLILLINPIGCKEAPSTPVPAEYNYTFSQEEIDLMNITNQYRQSLQLNTLQPLPHIGYLCKQHDQYMIERDTINHDYFYDRQVNLQQIYRATYIGEIIAYNYQTNQAVLQAWINSPKHAEVLTRPTYTNFGVSITTSPFTNKKYYTFIFINK